MEQKRRGKIEIEIIKERREEKEEREKERVEERAAAKTT